MAHADLLTPVVPEDKLHPSFRLLITHRNMSPAQDMLRAIWAEFPNPDRHFIREFQTAHFDARIWELYVFAVAHYGPFTVTRPHEAPDFHLERDGFGAWIEATTANPSEKYADPAEPSTLDEADHLMHNVVPIRLGTALYAKLKKKDWKLPHVAGHPYVLAIGDFSQRTGWRRSDTALYHYLYGVKDKVVSLPGEIVRLEYQKIGRHAADAKEIPSGLFDLPDAENISAVLFSNEGTLPKFKRMAFDLDRYPGIRMIRVGSRTDFDPRATVPRAFAYLVGDDQEDWWHGITVFHHPRAKHPIPLDFFDGFGGQYWFVDGKPNNRLRGFSPYSSVTLTFAAEPGELRLSVTDDELRAKAARMERDLDEDLRKGLEFEAWRDKLLK